MLWARFRSADFDGIRRKDVSGCGPTAAKVSRRCFPREPCCRRFRRREAAASSKVEVDANVEVRYLVGSVFSC